MIKFFRKIRQNLLLEGKTGKYFKYAIGEIILVVIGILIALQINNLNEERKNQKQAVILKQALKTELKSDLALIKTHLKYMEDVLKINNSYAERLSSTTSNLDTLVQIVRHEYQYGYRFVSTFDKTTFNSLMSTGSINLLGNHLASNVQKYYRDREETVEIYKANLLTYTKTLEAFRLNFPDDSFPIRGHLLEEYWKSADLNKLNIMFNALLRSRITDLNIRKKWLNKTVGKTQNLINHLRFKHN